MRTRPGNVPRPDGESLGRGAQPRTDAVQQPGARERTRQIASPNRRMRPLGAAEGHGVPVPRRETVTTRGRWMTRRAGQSPWKERGLFVSKTMYPSISFFGCSIIRPLGACEAFEPCPRWTAQSLDVTQAVSRHYDRIDVARILEHRARLG